jgi:hypothetical protein
MIQTTINNLPCVAITPDLAERLCELGEDPAKLNYLRWPAGASNYAQGVFLMHSDDARQLASTDRSVAVALALTDDTQTRPQDGVINPGMYQIEHRPVHTISVNGTTTSLVAVTVVDTRYFWTGTLVNDGYNMTTTGDRTAYYTQSELTGSPYTLTQLINVLLTSLGITSVTEVVAPAATPNDQLINGERAGDALDRLLASAGLVLFAYPTVTGGKWYCIDAPSRFNVNTLLANDRFLADRVAGDIVSTAGTADGRAWYNATMPSSVTVLFPREIPASAGDTAASANPPVMRQFYTKTSTAGKPSGVTGRAGYTEALHDTMWAIGTIGSETNAAALATRADAIATAYYARYSVNRTVCKLKGYAAVAPIPGVVTWRLTPTGPYTEINTNENWGIYGGNTDVVDGFNRKRVIGLGGTQTFQSFDGSLYVGSKATPPGTVVVVGLSAIHTGGARLSSTIDAMQSGTGSTANEVYFGYLSNTIVGGSPTCIIVNNPYNAVAGRNDVHLITDAYQRFVGQIVGSSPDPGDGYGVLPIVRISHRPASIVVTLSKDAGSDGSSSTSCSWTYTVSGPFASNGEPYYSRSGVLGKVIPATRGIWDEDNDRLKWCDEMPNYTAYTVLTDLLGGTQVILSPT